MLIKKPSDISSSEITPKSNYVNRRKFMAGAIATGAALAGGYYLRTSGSDEAVAADGAKLSGIVKSQFSTTEKPTSFKDITNYNNYYEFSTDKYEPNGLSKNFRTRPWTVKIDGKVKKAKTLDIDSIMKLAPLEERIYRHRCVEGLRMDEAMHPLAILVVGLYDEVLPNVDGAPLRLVVPWKYGFKSIKAI